MLVKCEGGQLGGFVMNVGFVSTRLAGTDGVSLETAKWATVLRRMGHRVFYCAGELDANGPPGLLVPEMHFTHPEAKRIHDLAFGTTTQASNLRSQVANSVANLKARLLAFINDFQINIVVAQNVFAIPMQVPLGMALREVLLETGLPAIAHNHDFYWERERFQANCIPDILETAFPSDLPNLRHVVINSLAQRSLKIRRGIESTIIPNVFDFDMLPPGIDDYNADLRQVIGLTPDDLLFLQPTRVVPRKGIELAIELVSRMQEARCKLVITHPAGDEGLEYLHRLQTLAKKAGVDLHYAADHFNSQRDTTQDGRKIYSLWDAYPHADFVTYPSLYEGFGNALIETVYFKKPALVNRYPVYVADIGPLGFDFVEIDGRITDAAVAQVQELLADPARCEQMVEHNYRVGQEHFSLGRLEELLRGLLEEVESS
jgi:glycosyltransferase involved in cell wall biosynthesis